MRDALAIIAALIATFSTVPYLIDIVHRRTKPNVVTWLTWTILTAIATAAAFVAHEPRTALLTLGGTLCTAAVVVVGLKYGITKFTTFDIVCQVGAVVGLVAWLVFNSPVIGVVVPVVIDFLALLPTLRHSWLKPHEETWQAFSIGAVSSLLTVISLSHISAVSLLFPLYLLLANVVTATVIIVRRYQLGLSLSKGV